MWDALLKIVLAAGAVGAIAALSAKLARKSAALEQVKQEELEREKVDKIIRSNSDLGRDECLKRLRDRKNK